MKIKSVYLDHFKNMLPNRLIKIKQKDIDNMNEIEGKKECV